MGGVAPCIYGINTERLSPYSSYPDVRVKKDDNGREEGVIGSVSLLQNVTLATQPICSMDWNSDKVCCPHTIPISSVEQTHWSHSNSTGKPISSVSILA